MTAESDGRAIGERLAAIYRATALRMRDLPVYHAGLGVQAIGFRPFAGHVIGALATPWFLNIVLASADTPLPSARPGDVRKVVLPAGEVDFVVGALDGFGRLDSASLYSPMFDFTDDAAVAIAAAAAVDALLDPATATATDPAADPVAAPAVARRLDRRAFLTGRLAPGETRP